MKLLRYIIAISALTILGSKNIEACGPYYPDEPDHIRMFRCCSPELSRQWQEGYRFQDYEKEQNCLLWQKITSPAIPYNDIENVIYKFRLSDLSNPQKEAIADNKFAQWLAAPKHREDLDYLLIAKEIEELREYMNDPWYYAYTLDDEHKRLKELTAKCETYNGKRHASRYVLQLARLYFAAHDFLGCIRLWERTASKMPQDIVTDMIASYAGGAYARNGNRTKSIELFTRSQDIGSLISLKAWMDKENESLYTDPRIKELEYIFNRFPNSPLLSVKLQEYVPNPDDYIYNHVNLDKYTFYNEFKQFAKDVISSKKCHQKGMWNYALAYLYYLDGNMKQAGAYLSRAEHSEATPFIKESIRAFRFLLDARHPNRKKLLRELRWLDEMMVRDANLSYETNWQYNNKLNWSVSYWQDVARRVLLGEVCPKLEKAGNTTLALQLANYASNRIYQISPYYKSYHYGWKNKEDPESYSSVITFEEYRMSWTDCNWFDYCNQFFEMIYGSGADDAARYAERISKPISEIEKFLNERSYVDTDYIYDIVGTLYMREMNYDKAVYWLSKVSKDYQARTNIAKAGYFKLNPFKYQFDKKQFIADSNDYKLRFAREMQQLHTIIINKSTEPNRRAQAKIRYATGLRNSFGKCWYLTAYGHDSDKYYSIDRESFKYNTFAQKAYKRVDALMAEALTEFTDREQAARALLDMKNFATLMKQYPSTKAASYVRTRCDNYHDYALQRR